MRAPTPSDVARQLARPHVEQAELAARFERDFSSLNDVCLQLGLDPVLEISDWCRALGDALVSSWLDLEVSGFEFSALWARTLSMDRFPSLFEALVVEEHLSRRAHAVGPYARSHGAGIASWLARARERIGNAAFHRALQMGATRRYVYARTLDLAREYLQFSLDYYEAIQQTSPALSARMGMVTVLYARIGQIDLGHIRRAIAELRHAWEEGHETALAYLLEAYVVDHDISGEVDPLLAARNLTTSVPHAALAEVWLRLAGTSRDVAVRRRAADQAYTIADSLGIQTRAIDEARQLMIKATARFIADESSVGRLWSTRGLSFPFLMRSAVRATPETVTALVPALLHAMGDRFRRGGYLFRDLYAEMASHLARTTAARPERIRWLREATACRVGYDNQRELSAQSSRLAQADDLLELAKLNGQDRLRREALERLVAVASEDPDDASALTLIAVDIERSGPLFGALLRVEEGIALAIRNGDANPILEKAARRALDSRNTHRTHIGGRGGTQVVTDVHGITGGTFVFKTMSRIGHTRDLARTRFLSTALSEADELRRFGVIEHVTDFSSPGDESEVVSVRRFMEGDTLHQTLIASTISERAQLLARTAEFLAFIHSRSEPSGEIPSKVRSDLLGKEVGRWLRILADGEHAVRFSRWWSAVVGLPSLPRRDAHAHNWLISDGSRVSAVDLDSVGWRPLGYELLQLIDDHPYIPVADAPNREIVYEAYFEALARYGIVVSTAVRESAIRAGQFARAIRSISDPERTPERVNHALAILDALAETAMDVIGRLAADTVKRWAVLAGRAGQGDHRVSDATRHRISRAIAFHLRHDRQALVNRGGWMHVDELVLVLKAGGHKVSRAQVIEIAGAMGEPRYQCDGDEIRALYGHSTAVDIQYRATQPPPTLYHATPLDNLPSIIEAQDGLRPGERNWVHLADTPAVSMRAARRQGRPVALLAVDTSQVSGVVQAAPETYLAASVPLSSISIVPLRTAGNLGKTMQVGSSD